MLLSSLFANKNKKNGKQLPKPSQVVLLILDGFGVSPLIEGNAIRAAKTPNIDFLQSYYPKTLLHASGNEVGLPYGEAGNSEVGHLNIGAGRIIYQPLLRVTRSINNKELDTNQTTTKMLAHLKKTKGDLHLVGLLSAGGVHSHIDHLFSLIEWADANKLENVYLHLMTDGRDSLPAVAESFFHDLDDKIKVLKNSRCTVASISGRLYGMDRDHIWDRTHYAYRAIINDKCQTAQSAHEVIQKSYAKGLTDEFIDPHTILTGKIAHPPKDGDAMLFFNIRPDRSRQLAAAFSDKNFKHFKTKKINNFFVSTLTEYDEKLDAYVVFPEPNIKNSLGEIIAQNGMSQLRIAETQKYAHVTYFFNGGIESAFKGEKRMLIPSYKISDFSQKPEMGTKKITESLLREINNNRYDFIVANFANADMVGHTGNFAAAVRGIEIIDDCIGQIASQIIKKGGVLVITADHGNAEEMLNFESGSPDTEHNIYPVPLMVIQKERKNKKPSKTFRDTIAAPQGVLADIAPTILDLIRIEQPPDMTGVTLINSMH